MMLSENAIKQALRLFEERKSARAMLDRIGSEPVSLMVGSGPSAGRIDLNPEYLAGVVNDLRRSFDQQIAAIDARLTEMGVEP